SGGKIHGNISFKYDIRQFNNEYGDGEIFSFDIRDNTGEITVVCFNLSSRLIEPRIQKDKSYEITDLCIRTANKNYKTLPNQYQLTSTNKTTVVEIIPFYVTPIAYILLKLEDLNSTDINSVIDIQCRVIRDYGISTGISNNRSWTKRELHILEGSHECRLSLWNQQARLYNESLARKMIKCKYIKVKWYNEVSVADIAHLIVRKKNNQWSLSVDLHVYCKNQQFRLYDSIKIGSNNPLTITSDYPFQQTKSHCCFDILRKSLITNTASIHTSLLVLKDKYLFHTQTPLRLNYESIHIENIIVKTYNPKDFNDFQFVKSSLFPCHKQKTKNISFIQKQTEIFTNTICNSYIPFIQNIITQDNKHIGKIESFVQGNRNTNKLIFNITGNYRYCTKIAAHHKRNCTAIIIDISNNTYAIRCKDPQCDNTFLTWHDIEKL
ncbi:unnamed protein product, partial [Rotaria sp. Silwood1]